MAARMLCAIALTAALVACDNHSGVGPSPPAPPGPTVVLLRISGPATIAPGETAAFVATGMLSDGSTAEVTNQVRWQSLPTAVMTISSTGMATGVAPGDARVTASGGRGSATSTVTVLPPGTFRLSGRVLESGLPVLAASVTVVSGTGTGQSSLTDVDGHYRLYGVAGPVRLEISKASYDTVVRDLTVTGPAVMDFTDFRQAREIPSLAGAYTLALTADGTCRTLPEEQRHRTYAATVTQTGPILQVTLGGGDFVSGKEHFPGRIAPDGVTFNLGDVPYYLYLHDLNVIEQLGPATLLTFTGAVYVPDAPDALSAIFVGFFANVTIERSFVRITSFCPGRHQFTMTRR